MNKGNIKIAHIQTKDEQFKADFDAAIKMIPNITALHRSIYDGMLNEGYNELQSFDFANKYLLQLLGGAINGNSK